MTKKGFTLLELLVVIAIIGLLTTIAIVSVNSVRAKARDSKRLHDVTQLALAFQLYFNDNEVYPSTPPGEGTVCIGVPSAETCWGNHSEPGSDQLSSDLSPYVDPLPIDPLPVRGWGDRYLYTDVSVSLGCDGPQDSGHFILWRPDKDAAPFTDEGCLGKGLESCCPFQGPCGDDGGYMCAFQID